MAVASCVISYALGLVSIDMFCDHYAFISPSMTSDQINTCTAYYRNASRQPWYLSLVTLLPILIGAIVMFRNLRRTIYDTLSIPLFVGVVGLFLFRIKNYLELLATEVQASKTKKEEYLRQIAYTHGIIAVLLVLLLVLQALATNKAKALAKKTL